MMGRPILSRAAIAALFLSLIVAACGGGGGGSSSAAIAPAAPAHLRTDLLFGYYGMNTLAVAETADHVNLVMAAEFYGPLEQMGALTQAKGQDQRTVVALPLCFVPIDQAEAQASFWLARLHAARLLDATAAITWCDEPNTDHSGSWTDEGAIAMVAAVRRAMAGFAELAHTQLWVIYACKGGSYPGARAHDAVACDDYDSGCGVVGAFYGQLQAAAPAARLFLVAGGASPYKQDPACLENIVHSDPRFVALLAWIYQTVSDGGTFTGIRDNGMRPRYCAAGRRILAASTAGCV